MARTRSRTSGRWSVLPFVAPMIAAAAATGCLGDDQVDTGDPNVEQIVFQYDDGDLPDAVWRALRNAGAARECAADDTLRSVRFRVADVPENPPPAGWGDVDVAAQEQCEDLLAGFPF